MEKINIAYDYEYDYATDSLTVIGNVDIIEIPKEIFDNLKECVQKFFDWSYKWAKWMLALAWNWKKIYLWNRIRRFHKVD